MWVANPFLFSWDPVPAPGAEIALEYKRNGESIGIVVAGHIAEMAGCKKQW